MMISLQRRLLLAAFVSIGFGRVAAAAPTAQRMQHKESSVHENKLQIEFENLIRLKNRAFSVARSEYLADPGAIEYLKTRFDDPDPVVSFAARQLFAWADNHQNEISNLEHFLQVEEPSLRKLNRTAKGGGGVDALFKYLGPYLRSQPDAADRLLSHLLFRNLMEPALHSYIGQMLYESYAKIPVPEPEVWLRIAIDALQDDDFDYFISNSLAHIEKQRLKKALVHEKSHALRSKTRWPAQLEALLKAL